jgi:hypothetical protein
MLANEEGVVMGYKAIIVWENALGMIRNEVFIGGSFLAVKADAEKWLELFKDDPKVIVKETKLFPYTGLVFELPKTRCTMPRSLYANEGSTDAEIIRKRY